MLMNMDVREVVQQPIIPVYGVVEQFRGLQLITIGKSFRSGNKDGNQVSTTITLCFSAERRPGTPIAINIHSCNSQDEQTRENTLKMLNPLQPPRPNKDSQVLRTFRFDESEQRRLGSPINTVEQITIAQRNFSAEVHAWNLSPRPAWFLLQNEDALFFGESLGLSKDELRQVLEHCVEVNHRVEILHQYQLELDWHVQNLKEQQGNF
jgi:hypothetical protein